MPQEMAEELHCAGTWIALPGIPDAFCSVTDPQQRGSRIQPGANVLEWAVIFFLVSLVAGYFGFGGVASGTRTIAKVLFFLAITIFLVVLVFGVLLGTLVF